MFKKYDININLQYQLYFLNQAYAWFLEITLVQMSVCGCLYVRPPRYKKLFHMGLNNQSGKSYCFSVYLYSTCYRYNQ